MKNGALDKKFDAYPQRQSVTESININSLTDHHIWSTIKTLPATLPEPKFRVSRANALQHSDCNLRPRSALLWSERLNLLFLVHEFCINPGRRCSTKSAFCDNGLYATICIHDSHLIGLSHSIYCLRVTY